jgi:hypothetical protein
MTMRIVHCLVVAALVSTAAGCNLLGPEPSYEGEWTAPGPGHSGYYLGLSLRQSGDTVTGVACALDSGITLYSNAVVRGDYPDIRVEVTPGSVSPCCAHLVGQTYTATMEDRGEIVGPSGLRFTRASQRACP